MTVALTRFRVIRDHAEQFSVYDVSNWELIASYDTEKAAKAHCKRALISYKAEQERRTRSLK